MNSPEDKEFLVYVFEATSPHSFVGIIHEKDCWAIKLGQYSYWTNLSLVGPWGLTQKKVDERLAPYNVTPENVPAECKAYMLLEGYPT